jgi:phosphohistidine swiveling domain-containing protein
MTRYRPQSLAIRGQAHARPLPADAGGKAAGLERIVAAGLRTAPWFVVRAAARPRGADAVSKTLAGLVADACGRLVLAGAEGFAVRSSALDEDGIACSFAGQHLTLLNVPDAPGVLEAIRQCWESAGEPSARAYRAALGLPPESPGMAVIVQAMVRAECSGIAFSEAPQVGREALDAPGSPEAIVVATRGLGVPLVSGEVNGDEYRVRADGVVVVCRTDPGAWRLDALAGGGLVRSDGTVAARRGGRGATARDARRGAAAPDAGRGARCLDDERVRAIAGAAWRLARQAGTPQDVEWAIARTGELYLLQARPITAGIPGTDRVRLRRQDQVGEAPANAGSPRRPGLPGSGDIVRLWDNANIVESFSGVTLPLTYSVAREAYASVYRGACRAFGVPRVALDRNAAVFDQMIGHIEGRVYYNVSSWHRVLALLPGFGTSQQFLERMMGAARPGSRAGERAEPVAAAHRRVLDAARVAVRCGVGLVLFERRARGFERLIGSLTREVRTRDLDSMSIEQLIDLYDEVRTRALTGWHVTIFNDLAVMVVHGALRRATESWLDPTVGPSVNGLLRSGELASTAPGAEIQRIARRLRREPAWQGVLDGSVEPLECLRTDPSLADLRQMFEAYLARWGDRCPGELQLDRPTYSEEPAPILSTIRALASAPEVPGGVPSERDRAAAWEDLAKTCHSASKVERSLRIGVLRSLVDMMRYRLAWRERMRFARTEVFAIGRRIFRSMDRQFVDLGILDRPGDLHYLDIAEIRGAIRGTIPAVDLGLIVADRRERFARFAAEPGPPSRFETAGPVVLARRGVRAALTPGPDGVRELAGTPVWTGRVRGRCLPVEDPRATTPRPGEIVVARSTDPGWVPILLSAAGLLVERGSLLSHSAIVARELGLPTIVGIDGLMAVVRRGTMADMDGSSGVVRLGPAPARLPATTEGSR